MSCVCGVVTDNNSVSSVHSRSYAGRAPGHVLVALPALSRPQPTFVEEYHDNKIRARWASLPDSTPFSTGDFFPPKFYVLCGVKAGSWHKAYMTLRVVEQIGAFSQPRNKRFSGFSVISDTSCFVPGLENHTAYA